ncbi:MAG: diguanylate cyclase [Devosia nanyangense]|uniref:Diguanylate cyclase n=1 Tax=Devosia nanyangense TaxID=1228055 RepID=A0A933L0I2_9HYPH|nr:diguanylate cyclase [Devosia nanyangense]
MTESRWKFSVAVLLPVAAAVLVTLALTAGFILWSASRTDERALEQQQALAAHMIAGARSDFEGTQGTEVLRYDAVEAFLGDTPDTDWIESSFGAAGYDDFGHDRVYVLDPSLTPIYAARDGESAGVSAYDQDRAAIDPLAVRFRSPERAAQIAAYQDGSSDWPPQVSDIVDLGGRAAMVAVLPIVSDWEGQEQAPGHFYLHVAVKFLGSDVADDLMDQYLLAGAHFDTVANTLPGEAVVPIANAEGRFVAFFKWQPERPGQDLLRETLPASGGLLVVVAAIIGLLLAFLARSTAALDKARVEALFRATHDPLTGLANRALFTERLERAPLPLALLALDLDRFKAVNDTLGHEAGDDLLRQVSGRLLALVRATDTVARLGGDEFMILVSGTADSAALATLAGTIVAAISEPFRIGRDTAQIGVSVGIATAVADERKDLVSRADFALYDAKESGRNTFRVFDRLARAA